MGGALFWEGGEGGQVFWVGEGGREWEGMRRVSGGEWG